MASTIIAVAGLLLILADRAAWVTGLYRGGWE